MEQKTQENAESTLTLDDMIKSGMTLEFLPKGVGRVLIKKPHSNIISLKINEIQRYFSKRFNVYWDNRAQKFRATILGTPQRFSGSSVLAVLDEVYSFK